MKFYCTILLLTVNVKNVFCDQTCSSNDFAKANVCLNQTVHLSVDKSVVDKMENTLNLCFAATPCKATVPIDPKTLLGIKDNAKCFLTVANNALGIMESCIRKKYPTFTAPKIDDFKDVIGDKSAFMEKIITSFLSCKSQQLSNIINCAIKATEDSLKLSQQATTKACSDLTVCANKVSSNALLP